MGTTIPDKFRRDPNDTTEERDRKSDAFSAWIEQQAEQSRDGAIAWVRIIDLDIPLVRYLTDEEVERTLELSQQMHTTLKAERMDGAATLVQVTLMVGMKNAQARREHATEHARIAVDANGHEVQVVHDGAGWWPGCSCDSGELAAIEPMPQREDAVRYAAEHAAEHAGAWSALTD